jgi:aspartate kinase
MSTFEPAGGRMGIVVQKFGGSSVANVERMRRVADRIAATRAAGHSLVVVVSAMGDTTDGLLKLAHEICDSPSRRELDMLLSTGERISMALLAMALNSRGIPALSFTGSQSGIITNDDHTNARIIEVRPFRVQDELARGKVVIVAGYQGVSYGREVTTLGRGGSDTTAVALAAALDAQACEIYSDVDGVYTADPRVVPEARRLAEISYEEMQELAEAGAKVLNAQAVEFAKDKGIAIFARATSGGTGETVVRRFPPKAPGRVVGVTSQKDLVMLSASPGTAATMAAVLAVLDQAKVGGRQVLFDEGSAGGRMSLVLPLENLHDYPALVERLAQEFGSVVQMTRGVAAVSAIGAGINPSFHNLMQAIRLAAECGARVFGFSTSSFRISLLIEESNVAAVVRRLHAELVSAPAPS